MNNAVISTVFIVAVLVLFVSSLQPVASTQTKNDAPVIPQAISTPVVLPTSESTPTLAPSPTQIPLPIQRPVIRRYGEEDD